MIQLILFISFWNAPSAVKELLQGLAAVDLACLCLAFTSSTSRTPLIDVLALGNASQKYLRGEST